MDCSFCEMLPSDGHSEKLFQGRNGSCVPRFGDSSVPFSKRLYDIKGKMVAGVFRGCLEIEAVFLTESGS
ncbi:MAG: hypothetical protein CSA81_02110 [Acidobacteria bacterium]|nr:MAG: hypothetical protein CSA81_02110 [Acidobacteriota bacterium]